MTRWRLPLTTFEEVRRITILRYSGRAGRESHSSVSMNTFSLEQWNRVTNAQSYKRVTSPLRQINTHTSSKMDDETAEIELVSNIHWPFNFSRLTNYSPPKLQQNLNRTRQLSKRMTRMSFVQLLNCLSYSPNQMSLIALMYDLQSLRSPFYPSIPPPRS